MGSGSSHCRRCQQIVDSYGNVQVKHEDFCDRAGRIFAMQRSIETRNHSIDDLFNTNWKLDQEIIRLKEQNEDFRKANKDLARRNQELESGPRTHWKLDQEIIRLKEQNDDFRKANKDLARRNQSLQQAIARERKVMYQSHEDLRKQATDLENVMGAQIYAYKNELAQANEKIILDAEKIQNQRNQLRNLNQKQEQLNLRPVFKRILSLLVTPLHGDLIKTDNTAPRVTLVALVELGHFEHSFRRGDTHLDRITGA